MKIKCITNQTLSVPPELLNKYSIDTENFSIKPGKEYIVYAVWIYLGYIWYCICDEDKTFYPMWNPSMLFEITDNRLSRYWIFSLDEDNDKRAPFLSFPEWANDPYFYEELVDGNSIDINAVIFKKYKELMELEFPNSSISEIAQIGDEEWLICPKCVDAWQSTNDKDALVKCPKCQTIFNNPRYKVKKCILKNPWRS
jgi:uncharacterized C2H2 Zn-finger protein